MKGKDTGKMRFALFILIICVAVVAVNILVSNIVDKYSLKWDMTRSGLYQITKESIDLLKTVDQPVQIYCISKGRDSIKEFSEILDKYDNASDFVTVEYIDPYSDLIFMDRMKGEGEEIGLNTIIIERGSQRRVYRLTDMYRFSPDGNKLVFFDAEGKITSGILSVASDKNTKLGVAMGHGENMPSELQSLAIQNNFELRALTLNREIEDDCGTLLLLSPQTDYELEEISVLDHFLQRGGCLAVFTDPSVTGLNNLNQLLSEWGLVVHEDVVFDAKNNTDTNPSNLVAFFSEHPINDYFKTNQFYLVSPATRSLEMSGEVTIGQKNIQPVLVTSDDAYGRNIDTDQKTLERLVLDEAGPFVIAATSTQEFQGNDGRIVTSRIFTMGSKRFYSDEMMTLGSVGNAKFMVNLLKWCDNSTDSVVSIAPKQVGGSEMAVLPWVGYTLGILFTAVIPAIILIVGVRVYYKRKHL
ncbi:GldG family protein [Lachnospiraceae bacterium ZAX-1]